MKWMKKRVGKGAFTLMEVVMALAVIGTMGAGAYVGFNSLITYAISSRLYSEAQTAAQNRIDLILSKEPFDPSANPQKLPADPLDPNGPSLLAVGTKTIPNVFIYKDPANNNNVVVTGTLTTTVTDPGSTMTFAGTSCGGKSRCKWKWKR